MRNSGIPECVSVGIRITDILVYLIMEKNGYVRIADVRRLMRQRIKNKNILYSEYAPADTLVSDCFAKQRFLQEQVEKIIKRRLV